MKPFFILHVSSTLLGYAILIGQKPNTEINQLFFRIQNAEAKLENLRESDSNDPKNVTSSSSKPRQPEQNITRDELWPIPAPTRQGKSKFDQLLDRIIKVEARISSQIQDLRKPALNPTGSEIIKESILPVVILPGNIPPDPPISKEVIRESKLDQLLGRINAAQAKISTLQKPQIQEVLPSLVEPGWEDSVLNNAPLMNESPPPLPDPIPSAIIPPKEQGLPVDPSPKNQASKVKKFPSRKSNEVRFRFAYIFPFESDYIQPTTGTSLPLSYQSGKQFTFEYLFGSELLSLGTSVLWSESKHRQIGPIKPLGTFPAQGRTRSFGGSLLARLSKDINQFSFEALLSLGLSRRLDEFRFNTGYFSEAGLSFLYSFDLGIHYEIFEDHKAGIYWRYQNLAGLNHNTENQSSLLGISYARQF